MPEPTELQSIIQMRQGFEEEFDSVLNDVLTLQKSDGRVFEKIKAHVSPKGILIMDVQLPIEVGDKLIRTLPNGLREEFIVDDPGYRAALAGIPAHFLVRARRAPPIDSLKPSSFWRSRRTDFEELSSRQRAVLNIDRDHPRWLRGFCSRLDDNDLAYSEFDGGLDSEFRSKFEEVTTQAAIALGSPADADPVAFWLRCLCSDLLQNPAGDATKELLQSVPGGGFFVDLLASSSAYCSRFAAKADRKAHDAHFRRDASSGNEAEEMEKAVTVADNHLATPRSSGTIGAEAPFPGAKKRGRRPNQERLDAIQNAISTHGHEWRDHLSAIFNELDKNNVSLGDFQGREITLDDGETTKVWKWEDLDLAEGDQRRQIVDALRKYLD